MENNKTSCILFKTVFDAALRFTEENQTDLALDILLSYGKYAFGYTEGVEAKSLTAEVIVNQNLPSLDAASRRYNAAVENGKKGKEYGKLGKEYGKKGGRPRKGETKEEAKERRENEAKTPQKTPLTVSVSDSLSISKSISDKNKELNNLSIDIPTIELKEGKTSPGTPNACQPVKSRLDNFDLASANKLPDMERRLEHQYYYVLKDLPALEKNHYSFTESCYLKETLDWVEATEDFPVLTNCMLMWYDGGRAKLAEMVQGLAPNVTKDILTYLVLSGKYYDAQTSMNNYQPVYSV